MAKPQLRTIRSVVDYLENELGLHIYGTCIDFEKEVIHQGLMDYSIKDIETLRSTNLDNFEIKQC